MKIARDTASEKEAISHRAKIRKATAMSGDLVISAPPGQGADRRHQRRHHMGDRVDPNTGIKIASDKNIPQKGCSSDVVLKGGEASLQGYVEKFG